MSLTTAIYAKNSLIPGTPPTAPLGTSVYDTTSATFTPGFAPTGTITYTFTGSGLAALPVPAAWTQVTPTKWSETLVVSAGVFPNSDATGPLGAGDYNFAVTFAPASGEPNYVSAAAADEPLHINK